MIGPIIASLSLGSDAEMKFRKKKTKKSLNMPSASPESSASLESLLNDDFKFSDVKGRNNMPIDSLEFSPNTRSNGPPLILTLHHGDIVIMVGHEIQKRYE